MNAETMSSNDRLRRNLRALMSERGVTQRDLEARAKGEITQAAISYILSGTNVATLTTVDILARLLRVTPAILIGARNVGSHRKKPKDWSPIPRRYIETAALPKRKS